MIKFNKDTKRLELPSVEIISSNKVTDGQLDIIQAVQFMHMVNHLADRLDSLQREVEKITIVPVGRVE